MRIQHNIMAMNAYRNYTTNTSALSKNLEKLSSGYKINRAGDDAAGLAISEKMRAQITGLKTAQKNVKDGISLVKTAEGATQEIHDMLNRMVDLATQSANGTYQNEVDREAITNEFEQLKSEINRIADSSNFNGIKLLDGSLDTKGASKVVVKDIQSTNYEGVAGKVTQSTAFADTGAVTAGDSYTYSIGLSDGTSLNFKLTVQMDDTDAAGKKGFLVDENGKQLGTIADTTTKIAKAELENALKVAMENNDVIKGNFKVSLASDKFTFENLEKGVNNTTQVTAIDAKTNIGGTEAPVVNGYAIDAQAKDPGRDIDAGDITLYDGTNYEEAVFTINGHKFVVMDGTAANKPGAGDMAATNGLGAGVNILISDGTNNGLDAADANQSQNIAKIKEVTGLNVIAQTDNGDGIRLSGVNGNAKNGLTLQIGDTAESFNQLTVSVGDMHVKALGLDKVDLGTQTGAQAAITAIKDAINQVSTVRGTLGATQNRLEHTQNNLSVMQENIQDAEATIRDTDIAEEMMAYTKNNILVQSAQAMLAQANQIPQGVLQLLG